MHTQQNEVPEKLDFASYIKKFFIHYKFDGHNTKIIGRLGLWATRNEKFNGMEEGWHIDRGILLSGSVGAGKDELFRLLRRYLAYLQTPYGYDFRVVWKFAKPFEKDGHSAFDQETTGNLYYEELALTDEVTGAPIREMVSHFGTKILIGSEIINLRAKIFKETGYQTHFSTNLSFDALQGIYGARCSSRLSEMCNYIVLTGQDRRGVEAPQFLNNRNIPSAPPARETTLEEHELNKRMLDDEYKIFCETGELGKTPFLSYSLLIIYKCDLGTEEELRAIMEEVAPKYVEEIEITRSTTSERARDKSTFIWDEARKTAVRRFYLKLRAAGAKTIFGIVSVDVDKLISTPVLENNKQS